MRNFAGTYTYTTYRNSVSVENYSAAASSRKRTYSLSTKYS